MSLRQKQSKFVSMVALLINYAYEQGYELTFGDAYRDPRAFGKWGEKKLYAHYKSIHKLKLAVDLNLFKDGKYLSSSKAHEPLGLFWERLHPDNRWGGRFNDGNHYSLTHWGVK